MVWNLSGMQMMEIHLQELLIDLGQRLQPSVSAPAGVLRSEKGTRYGGRDEGS